MSSVKFPCNISNISLLNSMIIKIYYIKKNKIINYIDFKKRIWYYENVCWMQFNNIRDIHIFTMIKCSAFI